MVLGARLGQAKFFRGWISSRSASRGVSPPKENKLKSSPGGHLLGSFHLEEDGADRSLGRQLRPGAGAGGLVSCDPHGASRLSAGDSVQGEARDGGQASPWPGTPCTCPELRAPKGPTLCFMLCRCYREILFFLN